MKRTISSSARPSSQLLYELRRLKTIARRWDRKAAHWDHDLDDPQCHLNEDDAYQRFLDQALFIIRRRKAFCARHGIIDAGCATGLLLGGVARWFAWGVGVDISPEMIRLARQKRIPKTKFFVGDCFNLLEHCAKASAIISRGVLLSHYGPRQGELLLKSAHDCLVDNGFVLLDFLNKASRDKYRHAPQNKTYFDPEEVCALAAAAGFRRRMIYGERERRIRMVLAQK